jgi:hypothetical protein
VIKEKFPDYWPALQHMSKLQPDFIPLDFLASLLGIGDKQLDKLVSALT